ncbi:MAG TPA: VOC family protein [Polyangia bacterium]|nr:VOC family protein [Polyangia bacterium]
MSELKLSTIGTIILSVRDLRKSLAFYRDALGLSVRFGSGELAFLDAGGVTLALRHVPTLGPPSDELRVELVFHVDDIAAVYDALCARGVDFRVEPRLVTGNQLAADFQDPDGHVLSLFGPRAAA